jgi:hypothetical protein
MKNWRGLEIEKEWLHIMEWRRRERGRGEKEKREGEET